MTAVWFATPTPISKEMAAKERLITIKKHLEGANGATRGNSSGDNSSDDGSCSAPLFSSQTSIPRRRQDLLKWNGWGYKDSKFMVDGITQQISFTGDRYKIGNKNLPHFKSWVESALGVDLNVLLPAQVSLGQYLCLASLDVLFKVPGAVEGAVTKRQIAKSNCIVHLL